jgi:hypothetical protein
VAASCDFCDEDEVALRWCLRSRLQSGQYILPACSSQGAYTRQSTEFLHTSLIEAWYLRRQEYQHP